ncbi:MAG: phosphotransferase, partial [Acidimicrobiales bacterium]
MTKDFPRPYQFHLIAGGRSNLTFRVTADNGATLVLRRPPIAHVLPTAHDMKREFRIISALRPTPVPVPEAIALWQDAHEVESAFYLMSDVPGHIL